MPTVANAIALEAHKRPTVAVEREADPNRPTRTAYRITGQSCADVQDYIASLIDEVATGGGFARFDGPYRLADGSYGALGEIILPNPREC